MMNQAILSLKSEALKQVSGLLRRVVDLKDSEIKAVLWSFAYFFSILCAYFILRPLRDEMAIAGGVRNLPWLFTGTFIVMLCVVPVFGALVSRFSRRVFIPYVYCFFIACLLMFWLLLQAEIAPAYVARCFFIWTSVFNLFIVSVFWSFMVDLYREEQSRRLFGFVAAGGTSGTLAGPVVTYFVSGVFGLPVLLLISAGLLGFSIICVRKLLQAASGFKQPGGHEKRTTEDATVPARPYADTGEADGGVGGGLFSGILEILKSPYLIGISVFVAMFTWTSTFLYFQQAHIIAGSFDAAEDRTQVFALIDFSVSALTLFAQIFVTGRFIKKFGVRTAAAFLPAVTLIGFGLFALVPSLLMLIVFQIVRRASNFAITRPGREMLFAVLNREQKYKSKNFIDTVVYRGGDAVSGWAFAGLNRGLGFDLTLIAVICIPIALVWMVLAWVLGQRQMTLAARLREAEMSQEAGLLKGSRLS